MSEITCTDLERIAADFIDETLDDDTLDAAIAHLADCASCRLTLDQIQQVRALGAGHGRSALSDEERSRLAARLGLG